MPIPSYTDTSFEVLMLEEMMRYVNNRFDRDAHGVPVGSYEGKIYTSVQHVQDEEGEDIPLPVYGEYYWIEGSARNDGLHEYGGNDLWDDEFEGRVVFLRVPQSFVAIGKEIATWCESNADAIGGPYQSESFGGYSYTMASTVDGSGMPVAAWQSRFGARLNPFRKMSRDWI